MKFSKSVWKKLYTTTVAETPCPGIAKIATLGFLRLNLGHFDVSTLFPLHLYALFCELEWFILIAKVL